MNSYLPWKTPQQGCLSFQSNGFIVFLMSSYIQTAAFVTQALEHTSSSDFHSSQELAFLLHNRMIRHVPPHYTPITYIGAAHSDHKLMLFVKIMLYLLLRPPLLIFLKNMWWIECKWGFREMGGKRLVRNHHFYHSL